MSAAGRSAVDVLKKYGKKPNKNKKANAKVEERAREIASEKKTSKEPSRNDLMLQAKAKGIKYFRILTKENLRKVLDLAVSAETVNAIVTKAKEEWQAGWGKKSKETTEQA